MLGIGEYLLWYCCRDSLAMSRDGNSKSFYSAETSDAYNAKREADRVSRIE